MDPEGVFHMPARRERHWAERIGHPHVGDAPTTDALPSEYYVKGHHCSLPDSSWGTQYRCQTPTRH
jgi:hypothetical protein